MRASAQGLPLPEQVEGRTATIPADVNRTVALGHELPLTRRMFWAATGPEPNAMNAASAASIAAKPERIVHFFRNCLFITRFAGVQCLGQTDRCFSHPYCPLY